MDLREYSHQIKEVATIIKSIKNLERRTRVQDLLERLWKRSDDLYSIALKYLPKEGQL